MPERNDISKELMELAPGLLQGELTQLYAIPDDYFDNFPLLMLAKLRDVNPRVISYQVPANYFGAFADEMLNHAKAWPLLESARAVEAYEVPDHYFETLPSVMMARIQLHHPEEADIESPVLQQIGKSNPYSIPSGYFDNTIPVPASNIVAPVVKMRPVRKVWKWAVAAAIAGLLVTGGWMYFNRSAELGNTVANAPAIPNSISTEELQSYLDGQAAVLTGSDNPGTGAGEMREKDIREMLSSIPDSDLQAYAEETDAVGSSTN